MSLRRLLYIIRKEFIHIRRDKPSLAIAIVMPIMMLFLFGYAIKTEISEVPTVVFDQDNTQDSRQLIQSYTNSNYFRMDYYVHSFDELEYMIYSGQAKAGLVVPAGFGRTLKEGGTSQAALYIDGSDPTVARTALSSGILVGQVYSLNLNKEAIMKKGVTINTYGLVDVRPEVWFNPELKSELFTIPGLIALIMQNITVILTSFALVREREKGTIEQLIVTPVKSFELIAGKMIPYVLIGFLEFLGVLVLGTYWFDVPVAGNLGLLILLGFGFVICALAIGMLISTIAKTQMQAMQASMLFLLPSILLSGFMFPREAMPQIIQWIGYLIPVTYFLDISRGIILKGVSAQYLNTDILMLLLLGIVLLLAATLRFRKKMD